jgi:hypothetical protein
LRQKAVALRWLAEHPLPEERARQIRQMLEKPLTGTNPVLRA